ncbi:PREDICTED: uncharacterized protein LOC107193388 [Dufourea novaeangliae]|uniref:uncharacterized protein LOC107193388 n=1 Tax=Dufourea novaeangliae TaxID=178035 RepID=UPI000767D259|nr:PREDICTED: uncharacterized protein LOC107193388 [Dufourea novaeangliae]
MQEQCIVRKDKLVKLEEGLPNSEEYLCVKHFYVQLVKTSNNYKKAILYTKLVLYITLLLFIGWSCYLIWQTYHMQSMEVKVTDTVRETEFKNVFEEPSIPDENTNRGAYKLFVCIVQKYYTENIIPSDNSAKNDFPSEYTVEQKEMKTVNESNEQMFDTEKEIKDDSNLQFKGQNDAYHDEQITE